jgi:NAD(P)-dependent dehydrogenase (short-subunit alcohol dehydrogenase family)
MKLETGQVAVVTGGGSGLGLALVEAFAARGLSVVVADVERDALAGAVAHLEQRDVPVLGVPTDVRHAAQVDGLAAATLDRFGRVDVICNNAGVTTAGPNIWETPVNDWEWVLAVNLWGVIHGLRAFVPHLVAQNSGHVVNTSSMAGVSVPTRHGPYLASKHAVVALSESLEIELASAAPNVGVTVVCPGIVGTNIAAAQRNRPDDLPGTDFTYDSEVLADLIAWSSTISGPEITAAEAAEIVVRDIEANKLHSTPNGVVETVRTRTDRLLADFEN